jgi:anti-sigma28 factor (negative regulator of flagellin synthesis)
MKITEIFSALFPKVRRAQGPKQTYAPRTDSKLLKRPDEVKLADEAKFIATLRTEMQKKIDLSREEKIKEIQRRIDEGNYNIESFDIASKILGE